MKRIVIDLETYYDPEYSLSKMTTEEYVNDPRFQLIGLGIKTEDKPARWFTDYTDSVVLADRIRATDFSDCLIICHNTRFDGAILAWKYGVKPAMWADTLGMARPFHNANVGGSLAKLSKEYGLGEKGIEVVKALGKRLEDFTPEELAQYGQYCINDCELTSKLYDCLVGRLPPKELKLIDLTLRMYLEPKLMLDPLLIQREIELDQQKKEMMYAKLESLNLGPKSLSSNDQFAAVLRSLGVEPPVKDSGKLKNPDGTPRKTWAFAKGDSDFVALLEHDDPLVVAAVEARMGAKSTQKQSRAQRFLGIASRMDGMLPVPLGYYNAHTGRYGGEEKINPQNLQRAKRGDEDSGLLRKAIMAPPGQSIVVMDFSQIEARVLAWLAQQHDKIEAFANKRDVYSEQATVIYGRKVDRKANPDDFTPGFIGKAVVLGCGYGLGFLKFAGMIYVGMLGEKGITFDDSYVDVLGVDVPSFVLRQQQRDNYDKMMANKPILLTDMEWEIHCAVAQKIITVFRNSNPKIVELWGKATQALNAMLAYREDDPDTHFAFGGPTGDLIKVRKHALLLPNGMELRYEGLEYDKGQFSFMRRKEGRIQRVKTYGGSVIENLTQALARIPTTDVMLKADKVGLGVALQAHDEVGLVVPTEVAQETHDWMLVVMRKPPKWADGLPLDAEGGIGKRYGEIK